MRESERMYKGNRPSRGGPGNERSQYAGPPHQAPQRSFRPQTSEIPREVASALKVKNFRKLVDAVGEEHLAVKLDLTIQRVKEMADGINLSNEMAYHIESSLGLQSGFIDQVNPLLTPEDIERLKTATSEPKHEEVAPARLVSVAPAIPATSATSVTAPNEELTMVKKSKQIAAKSSASVPAADATEAQLREVRRLNLVLLTSRPGTKTQLGALTGLSAANVSHRLHGNKIFDAETGTFFAGKLGLPDGWFEQEQSEATIPEATLALLTVKDANGKGTPRSPHAAAPRAKPKGPVVTIPKNLAPTTPIRSGLQMSIGRSSVPTPPAITPPRAVRAPAPVAAAKPQAAPAPVARAAASPVVHAAAAPVEALRPTRHVGSIVEALLQTLSLKAQNGQLSEEKALQMLVEVASI